MDALSVVDYATDCYKQYDNLGIAVAVFKGDTDKRFRPVFCNKAYTTLLGLTYEQFIAGKVHDNAFYCIHPDDYDGFRKVFLRCIEENVERFKHSVRVKGPSQAEYRCVSVTGKIKHAADGTIECFLVLDLVSSDYGPLLILSERYHNLIKKAQQHAEQSLSCVWFNVTQNTCAEWHRTIEFLSFPSFPVHDIPIDVFNDAFAQNIADENAKSLLLNNYNRKALIESFEKGILHDTQKIPVYISAEHIIWCELSVVLMHNLDTNDVECVMTLKEADRLIRIQKSFDCLISHDYDMIANINVHSGLSTVLNVSNARGNCVKAGTVFYYQDFLRARMEELVDSEFVDTVVEGLSLENIIEELKTKELFVLTVPAKTSGVDSPFDGAYQWRIGYIDGTKQELLLTRREVLGFLDKRQQAEIEESELQQQANAYALISKEGKSKRNKILVADDSDINRAMLSIIFENNFTILEAADGEEAINLIDKHYQTIALILLDMQMPKKTGLDVLIHLKMRNLNTLIPSMLVTGSSGNEMGLRTLEYGVSDIIKKPYDSKVVERRALNLIELYAHKEEVELQLDIWKQDALKLQEQQEQNNELLINALSSVVEFRSVESGTHIKRVRALTRIMLETWLLVEPEITLTDNEIQQIERASTLHDIGKVAIPDSILLKPGRLTEKEFDIMKTHTTLGCQMLEQFKQEDNAFYMYCYDICRYHHERADGRGYPDGLTDDKIPFWAQIVSIVDVYDALISPRVYKAAFTSEKAIEMIQNGECGTFSARLLNVFTAAKETIVAESERMAETLDEEE